jgi:hypothetical protein
MNDRPAKVTPPTRPWWRDPIAIGIASFVVVGSSLVLLQDRMFGSPKVDPANRTALPAGAGGSFCDTAPLLSSVPVDKVEKPQATDPPTPLH